MKHFYSIVLMMIAFTFAYGQSEVTYDFDTDEEGWNSSGTTLSVSEGVLSVSVNEGAGYAGIRSAQGLALDASFYSKVVIVMKNNTDQTVFQLINHDTGDSNFGNGEKSDFTITNGDTEFKSYAVTIPANPDNTSGEIDQIGLRVKAPAPITGSFHIESVTFLPKTKWTFEAVDDPTEGWKSSGTNVSAANGVLTADIKTATTGYAGIRSGQGLGLDMSVYTRAVIVIKNRTDKPTFQLFNHDTGSDKFGDGTSEDFDLPTLDTEFRTVTVSIPDNPDITDGLIDQLGIRVKSGPEILNGFDIQSITLLPNNSGFDWTFESDGNLESWSEAAATLSVSSGALTMTYDGTSTPKMIISGLAINSDEYPKMLLKVKNTTAVENVDGANNSVSMRVVTQNTNGDSKYMPFDHSANDTDFKKYVLNLAGGNYTGTINQLELHATRDGSAGTIEVDQITLLKSPNTWTGAGSDNLWENGDNWSWTEAPGDGEDVLISKSGNDPSITTNGINPKVNDLTIEDGAVVYVSHPRPLRVEGDLVAGTGYVDVTFGGSLVTSGAVSGDKHKFRRTTTFDESTGQYSVIGSPVAASTTDDLGSLVYSYNEATVYGTDGAARFEEVTAAESMNPGDAYFSAYSGTVEFTGKPNAGNIDVAMSYDANDGSNAGFNLVSNPYPAAIDFEQFIDATNNPDIEGTIYIWDDGGSDQGQRTNADYLTVNLIGGTGPGSESAGGAGASGKTWDGHLTATQGFFVKAKSAGTAHFTDAMKVTFNNSDDNTFRKADLSKIESLKLELQNEQSITNEMLIGMVEDATLGFDRLYDAYKFDGMNGVKIYSLLDGDHLSIQGLPVNHEYQEIPLGISVAKSGQYTISLKSLKNWDDQLTIKLHDAETNKLIDLNEGTYTFYSEAVTADNRFTLVLGQSSILGADLSKNLLIAYDQQGVILQSKNVQNVAVNILDLSGRVLFQHQDRSLKGEMKLDFNFEQNMVYIIKVNSPELSETIKVLFK